MSYKIILDVKFIFLEHHFVEIYKFLLLEKFGIMLLLLMLFGGVKGLKLTQDNEINKRQTRRSLVDSSFLRYFKIYKYQITCYMKFDNCSTL